MVGGKYSILTETLEADAQVTTSTSTVRVSPEVLNIQAAFERVASIMRPAVVNISTVVVEKAPNYEFFFGTPFEEFFGGNGQGGNVQPNPPSRRYEGIASGFIFSPDGYILTNEHVVHDAKTIRVTMADGRNFTGKLVGKDERSDIAVIKVNAGGNLTAAPLGDSDKIKVGDWAIAVGFPFGLQETVTNGIISAVRQSLTIEGSNYSNMIQTDAAINRGNSGGPLCNIYGEVIGINTAIYAPTGVFSGVGFAIPINSAKAIMNSLIQQGRVVRGWLGVEVRPVDDAIARQFRLPDRNGAFVNNVLDNSPAAKAGLQRGDVIRSVNGKNIAAPQDLQNIISQTAPNSRVQLAIIRNAKPMTVALVTGEMPQETAQAPQQQQQGGDNRQNQLDTASWQGMTVVTMNNALAQRFNLQPGQKGCLITDVERGSVADQMDANPGDIIVSVNRIPTPTINEFKSAISKVKLNEGVVLDVNRQGRMLYLSYSEH